MKNSKKITYFFLFLVILSCRKETKEHADIVIQNASIYTLNWSNPTSEGVPANDAPFKDGEYQFDAEAIAIKNGLIQFVGSDEDTEKYIGSSTKVIDAERAVVVPGLIESHGHVQEIGEKEEMISLYSLSSEEIIQKVYERSLQVPKGEWIVGFGWDEATFVNGYPDMIELSKKVPNHPVVLQGLRGFGTMGNALAFKEAGITTETKITKGGENLKNDKGQLIYVLLNRAKTLLDNRIPKKTLTQRSRILKYGLNHLASLGYTTAHHAGVSKEWMDGYEDLNRKNELPLRTQIFVAARMYNIDLVNKWLDKGPTTDDSLFLQVRSFKAYYDGSLGSRGASFLEDYSDKPGHKGVSSSDYGFHEDLIKKALDANFQLAIHCIGDEANRTVLDLYENYFKENPDSKNLRHRIEHAQIIHPDDFSRFSELNIIASMEPGHAVEDLPWAIDRVGEDRIKGGYAWRTLRRNGATVIFNSDYVGTDPSFFYGMYCATTKKKSPEDKAWFPEQAFTPEEALRAYTIWGAYASKQEQLTGTIEVGKWADLTFMDIDILNTAKTKPDAILEGKILKTMVNGKFVFEK